MKILRTIALLGAALAISVVAFATDIGPPVSKRLDVAELPVSLKFESASTDFRVAFIDGRAHLARVETLPIAKDFALSIVRIQDEPPAQSNWSGAWIYRLDGPREDRASAGILTKITTLTNVAGKFTLSLDGFAGFTLRDSAPTAAILIGANIRIADQLSGALHGGFITSQGKPTSPCIGASLNLKFAGIN